MATLVVEHVQMRRQIEDLDTAGMASIIRFVKLNLA